MFAQLVSVTLCLVTTAEDILVDDDETEMGCKDILVLSVKELGLLYLIFDHVLDFLWRHRDVKQVLQSQLCQCHLQGELVNHAASHQ